MDVDLPRKMFAVVVHGKGRRYVTRHLVCPYILNWDHRELRKVYVGSWVVVVVCG